MKMLGEENFDKILIDKILKYNQGKKRKIVLVFDSRDPMGDKITVNSEVSVVYAPHDKFYKSADDKICELLENVGTAFSGLKENDEYKVISEDNDLINRVNKISERINKKIDILKSSKFANQINFKEKKEDNDDELAKDKEEKINEELMKIWGK